MSHLALSPQPLTRTAVTLSPRAWMLMLPATVAGVSGALVPGPVLSLILLATGGSLASLAVLIRLLSYRHGRAVQGMHRQLAQFVALDAAPSFTTDREGQIGYHNKAAQERFGLGDGQSLLRALGDLFADPSAVLYRLQGKAAALGAAREDVVTRRGHLRLSVHRIGDEAFFWRLEEMLDHATAGRGAEALSLPMLTASRTGTVLFTNDAMRRLVGGRPKSLDKLFPKLPVVTGEEVEVAGAAGPVRAIVADIEGEGGRREIFLLPVGSAAEVTAKEPPGFEDLPVALLRLTPTGAVLAANRLARSLLNQTFEGEVRLSDLVEGLGRPVADWLADAASGRVPTRPEILRATQPDSDLFLQIMLGRIVARGRVGLVAVLNDATELKTLEAQFVQSQKMQAIGQLAGGIAHDFNNLLTAISGHCDLLLLSHDQGDPDYADLVQIGENANRAASLVKQLLAFSRKQTLQPEVVDLQDVLADLTHLLNRLVGERVTLSLSHQPDLRPIRADKRQLEQVLMNLVVNARDAMPQGGMIRIDTEALTLAEKMHRDRALVPPGDYVVVKVTDHGVGIPADKLTKIFEPFYTTKRTGEGTGLGLSTVYGIVKQTGGFVFVDSVVGSGTTFTLLFPAHDAVVPAQHDVPVQPERSVPRQGEGVILLVEDEAPVRAFASRALRMRGYTVLEAENGEQALLALSDPDLSVDVFISDVIMPGMDGPTWVRQALELRPGVRVVFISGYAEESFAETQSRIPNSVFLPKPFSLSELTAKVQEQIH